MFTPELKAFMKKYGISSAEKWQTNDQVSASTIDRILRGKNKDIGLNTFLMMITPYGATPDEVLGLGAFSPEALEKAELTEKIESAIETIADSVSIDSESAQEVVSILEEAQEYIATEPTAPITACTNCSSSLRETVAILKAENEMKDQWISQLLRIVSSTTKVPIKSKARRIVAKRQKETDKAFLPEPLTKSEIKYLLKRTYPDDEKAQDIVWDNLIENMTNEDIAFKHFGTYLATDEICKEIETLTKRFMKAIV